MRIGVMLDARPRGETVDTLVSRAQDLETRGFHTAWVPHVFGFDAVTTCALVGRETRRIELGTAVVPTQPRHPTALAQQALTAGLACGGRFTLGIGLSHPVVIESLLGLSYARREKHMREYLAVLGPLLRGEPASFRGEEFRVELALQLPEPPRVPVLLAALGPRMLRLAARTTDGTLLWMTGPRAIETHVLPTLRAAAREAGRPEPRVVAGMHIVLTNRPDAAKERLAKTFARYAQMPSYRAMLEREGNADPGQLALIGDEAALDRGLERLRSLGVSDFEGVIARVDEGAEERTLAYLASRLEQP
jgi:F420-dependent oxidoreductase-like protein